MRCAATSLLSSCRCLILLTISSFTATRCLSGFSIRNTLPNEPPPRYLSRVHPLKVAPICRTTRLHMKFAVSSRGGPNMGYWRISSFSSLESAVMALARCNLFSRFLSTKSNAAAGLKLCISVMSSSVNLYIFLISVSCFLTVLDTLASPTKNAMRSRNCSWFNVQVPSWGCAQRFCPNSTNLTSSQNNSMGIFRFLFSVMANAESILFIVGVGSFSLG